MSTTLIEERKNFDAELNKRNKDVRVRFNKYYTDNFEPKYRLIAEAMGLGYINFRRFATHKHDYGHGALNRVEKFLNEHRY